MAINVDNAFDIGEDGITVSDGDGNVLYYLTTGSGLPNGNPAPVNTFYIDDQTQLIYYKFGPNDADWRQIRAEDIAFDNSSNGFTSNNLQGAIAELGNSSSPGFGFGRSGSLSQNTWLRRIGDIPSNRTGVTINVVNPVVTRVAVSNRNNETFDVEIYEHDGDSDNLTLLGTVNVVNDTGGQFNVNFPATEGRQLAVRLGSTSTGSVRDLGVDLIVKGNST
jgi:hypothetical protein